MRMAARLLLVAICASALLALNPRPAEAHATILTSKPEPGQRLGTAPGVVILTFSEPLNRPLSGAAVLAPDGRTFRASASGEREVRIPLSSNAPGVYEVDWTAVSAVDGHTLRGSFRFGVGITPGQGSGDSATTPSGSDLVLVLARSVEYVAILANLGMLLLLGLAARPPPLRWVRPRLAVSLAAALLAGLAVVAGETLAASANRSPGALAIYFAGDPPGWARLGRLFAEATALVLYLAGRRGVTAAVLVTVTALSLSGHAASVQPTAAGATADFIHIISVGLWAGGVLALATLKPGGGWFGHEARQLLDRFSPVAVAAFALTVVTGTVRAGQELGAVSDLLASSYGQVLILKAAAVLAMAALSALAWRRQRARPRAEAAVALGVVAASAVLAAYPLPPAQLARVSAARADLDNARALPREGDLTIGDEAGRYLLGLTVRPGQPGGNTIILYLLPLEGEPAAAGVQVRASLRGETVTMGRCGPACRIWRTDLHGSDSIEINVGGTGGGSATFSLPRLPAGEGAGLVLRSQERMHRLSSYRVEESLGSGEAPVRSHYDFQAPDRMRVRVATGYEVVALGAVRYTRAGPASEWRAEPSIPLRVPFFTWDYSAVSAPRDLGSTRLEGRDTRVLSFFENPGGTPVWYRLWTDPEGLVWRADMMTQGHFMQHRYYDFDGAVTIVPP